MAVKQADHLARPEVATISPYLPGKSADEAKRELGLSRVLKLASNENPLGPSPKAVEAISGKSISINMYPDATGYELKGKLAAKYGLKLGQIILGNGSDELLALLGQVFVNAGDEAIMGTPSFPTYSASALLMGGIPVEVPVQDRGELDLLGMTKQITAKTKIIFVCNPNNPTGGMMKSSEVEEFMKHVPEDVIVVADQAYAEYVDDPEYGDFFPYLMEDRNVIVLHTFSKIYGLAGLRVGYGLGPERLLSLIERVKPVFNQNVFAQVAAIAALDDQEHVERSAHINRLGKSYLAGEFESLGFKVYPSWGNFLMADTGLDCGKVFQGLLAEGIIVRPATPWGLSTSIRVTIGTPEENRQLVEALQKILPGLKSGN